MSRTMSYKFVALALFIASVIAAIFSLQVIKAHANPSAFYLSAKTSLSTSTPAIQTPGTGTSTVVYDSYGVNGTNQINNGGSMGYAANAVTVLDQFSASSTLSQQNLNFEFSDDGIDWYQATVSDIYNGYATTSLPLSPMVPQMQWKFASSTPGQIALGPNNFTDTRAIRINVPTRYVRVIATCALGGANCATWMQILPEKEAVTQ